MSSIVRNTTIYKSIVSYLIAIILLSITQKVVFACTPQPMTPWFTEQLSFVETNLPPTVTHSAELTFVNTKESSFYGQFNEETKDLQTQISFRLEVYDNFDMILVNDSIFSDFEHHNKVEDNRPTDVHPPDFQDVVIPITLEEKQYMIKLRITYGVSNDYISNSVETYNSISCPYGALPWSGGFSTAIVVGVIILVLVVVIVIRRSKLSNKFTK